MEGVSDLYYLDGFKKVIGDDKTNFIFGGGAGNMAKVGTILRGWGCDILYLYDNDKGGIDAEKNLKKYWLFGERDVVYVVEPEGTIEDIFHPEDFRTVILDTRQPYTCRNSEYIRENKINKVGCSLKFKEYIDIKANPVFHETTLTNIRRLFTVFNDRFNYLEKKQLKKLSEDSLSSSVSNSASKAGTVI